VYGVGLIAGTGAQDMDAAAAEPGVRPFDMTGRPMRGIVAIESAQHKPDDAQAERQVQQTSPPRHRALTPPPDRACGVGRPERGPDELGERVCARPATSKTSKTRPQAGSPTACTAPALPAGVQAERHAAP
jgi:hypothetical protein